MGFSPVQNAAVRSRSRAGTRPAGPVRVLPPLAGGPVSPACPRRAQEEPAILGREVGPMGLDGRRGGRDRRGGRVGNPVRGAAVSIGPGRRHRSLLDVVADGRGRGAARPGPGRARCGHRPDPPVGRVDAITRWQQEQERRAGPRPPRGAGRARSARAGSQRDPYPLGDWLNLIARSKKDPDLSDAPVPDRGRVPPQRPAPEYAGARRGAVGASNSGGVVASLRACDRIAALLPHLATESRAEVRAATEELVNRLIETHGVAMETTEGGFRLGVFRVLPRPPAASPDQGPGGPGLPALSRDLSLEVRLAAGLVSPAPGDLRATRRELPVLATTA